MARTVEDATRVLEAMVGPDPADPMSQLALNVGFACEGWGVQSGRRRGWRESAMLRPPPTSQHTLWRCPWGGCARADDQIPAHHALQVPLPSNFTQYLSIGALRGTRIGVFRQIA